MISNISAWILGFEETINTLKYFNKAKNMKCKVPEYRKLINSYISEYIISDLR